MADLFGYTRTPTPMSVSSNTTSTITFSGSGASGVGALIQGWGLTHSSDPKEIFELGSNRIYWSRGRPTGKGNIDRIIGGKGANEALADAYNVCSGGAEVVINVKANNCDNGGDGAETGSTSVLKLTVKGLVITDVGFSTDVNQTDTTMQEKLGIKFSSLSKEENAVIG